MTAEDKARGAVERAREMIVEMRLRAYDMILAVARGGLVVAGVLAQELDVWGIAAIRVTGYDDRTRLARPEVHGKDMLRAVARDPYGGALSVLIVDDICDSGATLEYIAAHLRELGSGAIDACVLTTRTPDRVIPNIRTVFALSETPDDGWVEFPWETEARWALLGLGGTRG